MNKYYITTTIPYVNARPHVGFALELVQADVLARYHRLLGAQVRLQTGTDENALKNVLAAREQGITPAQLVARNSAAFRDLTDTLGVKIDRFIRTTDCEHHVGVNAFWRALDPGDLYRQSYRGLYCTGCEDFYLERDLADGCCPIHGRPPVPVDEENWFFRLSRYQRRVEDLLESARLRIVPEARLREILAFVRSGLRDFSVTRDARRAGGWGITVPGDPAQVIYVWFDALVNYLSGLGYGDGDGWRGHWNEDTARIHVIGKDVWKFHAVYWPAFLLSAGLPLPDTIVVHGFLTIDGRKISKSSGPAVDPVGHVERYGADAVRYYLLRAVPPLDDGDFSTERLHELYHADLANGLGNLVSRLTALCERAEYAGSPDERAPAAPEGYHEALAEFRFDQALKVLWSRIGDLNRGIEAARPWELLKAGRPAELHARLAEWLGELGGVAHWLQPFLPATSARILNRLRGDVRQGGPLFPRIGGNTGDLIRISEST